MQESRTGRIALLATLALTVGGCSAPKKPGHSAGEQLVWQVPADWKVAQRQQKSGLVLTQLIPEDQDLSNAHDMINVAVLLNGSGLTPRDYARVAPGMLAKSCPGLLGRVISNGQENGYDWAIWTHSCPSNPATGKVEIAYSKVIAGQQRLYLADRTWRYQPREQEIAYWTDFLQSIYLCDTDKQRQPCPASQKTNGGTQ